MFKIDELILYDNNDKEYTYKFSKGINYFVGDNATGKTEFYKFLDYMLGDSTPINDIEQPWFKPFNKATLKFTYNNITYCATRTKDPQTNMFKLADEEQSEIIPKSFYVDRLNQVFGGNRNVMDNIKEFTGESYSHRVFTMFNFLGEKGQGLMNNFLDKSTRDTEYRIKMPSLLDLIFNNHLQEIFNLEKEIEQLLKEVKKLEKTVFKEEYIIDQINECINVLDLNIVFNGTNSIKVLTQLEEAKKLNSKQKKKQEDVIELEFLFNHITEQIKTYKSSTENLKQIDIANKNRKILLDNLNEIIDDKPEYKYMVEPLLKLTEEMENSISFTNYIIADKTINELERKRNKIKKQLNESKHFDKMYNLSQKEKAFVLLENYLKEANITSSKEQLKIKLEQISTKRKDLQVLKKHQDINKIKALSEKITEYYSSGVSAKIVQDDISVDGFKITYIKNGNILQPQKTEEITEGDVLTTVDVNYCEGSMARHTLVQLSGYLAFLDLLLKEKCYPIVPILVIDHISKPFDSTNKKGIGEIINYASSNIGENNLQIFLFDDEHYNDLALKPNHAEELITENKTGFIPFYFPSTRKKDKN